MMTQISLNKAPIILAIAEIRYNLPEDFDLTHFSTTVTEFALNYPKTEKRISGELSLNQIFSGHPNVTFMNPRVDGLLFISQDKHRDFIISSTQLDFRQHIPYTGWKDFISEIQWIYKIFSKAVNDLEVKGISVRCINKIDIPNPVVNPLDYFNIAIQSREGVLQTPISLYSLKYHLDYSQTGMHAIINHSLEPHDGKTFPFILDIDIHSGISKGATNDSIWNKFEEIHILKNEIFDSFLTSETKSLFYE